MIRFQRIFYNRYFIRLSSISVVYAIASQLRCVCVCVFFPCFSPFVIHSTLKFRSKITLFLDLCVVWMLERERGGGKRVVRMFSILILLVFPASFSFSLLYCRTLVIRFCICFRRVCMISASFI